MGSFCFLTLVSFIMSLVSQSAICLHRATRAVELLDDLGWEACAFSQRDPFKPSPNEDSAVESGLIAAEDAMHHKDRHLISNYVGKLAKLASKRMQQPSESAPSKPDDLTMIALRGQLF